MHSKHGSLPTSSRRNAFVFFSLTIHVSLEVSDRLWMNKMEYNYIHPRPIELLDHSGWVGSSDSRVRKSQWSDQWATMVSPDNQENTIMYKVSRSSTGHSSKVFQRRSGLSFLSLLFIRRPPPSGCYRLVVVRTWRRCAARLTSLLDMGEKEISSSDGITIPVDAHTMIRHEPGYFYIH